MVVKFEAINKEVTAKVMKYISRGYIIRTQAMSGSQGEIASIDLTNGSEVVRVIAERGHHWQKDENDIDYEEITVKVIRATADEVRRTENDISGLSTIWNSHCEVIEETHFYQLNRDKLVYETSYEELKKARTVRHERYKAKKIDRREKFELSDRVTKCAVKILKNKRGFKRAKTENITAVIKEGGKYYIKVTITKPDMVSVG